MSRRKTGTPRLGSAMNGIAIIGHDRRVIDAKQ